MSNDAFDSQRDRLRGLHRDRPERRLAGVCAALSDHLDLPLPLVRAGFLIGAVLPPVSSLVILLYLALWFVTPPAPGEPSGFDRIIDAVRDLLGLDEARPRRAGSDEIPGDPGE